MVNYEIIRLTTSDSRVNNLLTKQSMVWLAALFLCEICLLKNDHQVNTF